MTRETLLAGLQDIRLPAEAPGGWAAEMLAAVGIGLLAAALVGLALRAVTRAAPRRWSDSVAGRVAATRSLPDGARTLALLRILKETRPAAYSAVAADLYRPGGLPAPDRLEAEALVRD